METRPGGWVPSHIPCRRRLAVWGGTWSSSSGPGNATVGLLGWITPFSLPEAASGTARIGRQVAVTRLFFRGHLPP